MPIINKKWQGMDVEKSKQWEENMTNEWLHDNNASVSTHDIFFLTNDKEKGENLIKTYILLPHDFVTENWDTEEMKEKFPTLIFEFDYILKN